VMARRRKETTAITGDRDKTTTKVANGRRNNRRQGPLSRIDHIVTR